MSFLGFTLAEKEHSCKLTENEEEINEKWICANAIPLIEQIFPSINISSDLTIIDESSHDHPKGCYIQKDEKDLTKYVVAFNIPPENVSTSTTQETSPQSTVQSTAQSVDASSQMTTTIPPKLNSTVLESQQICKLMDRK